MLILLQLQQEHYSLVQKRGHQQREIEILEADNKVNYIVYSPTTLEVIDFYSAYCVWLEYHRNSGISVHSE